MRVAISEGNQIYRDQLCHWVLQYMGLYSVEPELISYKDAETLIDAMSLRRFNIIILSEDGPKGFLDARRIRELDAEAKVVFITDTSQYAVMGVRLHLTDYIIKPADFKKVSRALKLAGMGNGR